MAGSIARQPMGLAGSPGNLNDGTLTRALTPPPGSVGGETRRPRPRATTQRRIQVLHQGSRGEEVSRLQRLLRLHLSSAEDLTPDGYFGPETLAAVRRYQSGVSIRTDGIVGRQTWYHLLKADKVTDGAPSAHDATSRSASRAPTDSIWDWPLTRKLTAVLERVPARLPGRARDEFLALLNLESLALSLGIIAGFCLLSGGTALLLGVALLGFDMTMSLAAALQLAALAATERELDEAADEIAHIVLAVGVAAFIKGVGGIAKGAKVGSPGNVSTAPANAPKPQPRTAAKAASKAAGPEPAPAKAPQPGLRTATGAAPELKLSTHGGVKAVRVRSGSSEKIAVIGRSMDDAVEPYSKGLREQGSNVETFSGDKISPEAQLQWKALKKKYAPDPIPQDVVTDSRMFSENRVWAEKLRDKGYTVVDVGNPTGQKASPFYEMEKEILFGNSSTGGVGSWTSSK